MYECCIMYVCTHEYCIMYFVCMNVVLYMYYVRVYVCNTTEYIKITQGHEASHHAISSSLLLTPPLIPKHLTQHPTLKHPPACVPPLM